MLLMIVKGGQSYKEVVYNIFKGACAARGLLNNDEEWYWTFNEAASWATSLQLRQLFVTMLLLCGIQNERDFFDKHWRLMTDDFYVIYNVDITLYNTI